MWWPWLPWPPEGTARQKAAGKVQERQMLGASLENSPSREAMTHMLRETQKPLDSERLHETRTSGHCGSLTLHFSWGPGDQGFAEHVCETAGKLVKEWILIR